MITSFLRNIGFPRKTYPRKPFCKLIISWYLCYYGIFYWSKRMKSCSYEKWLEQVGGNHLLIYTFLFFMDLFWRVHHFIVMMENITSPVYQNRKRSTYCIICPSKLLAINISNDVPSIFSCLVMDDHLSVPKVQRKTFMFCFPDPLFLKATIFFITLMPNHFSHCLRRCNKNMKCWHSPLKDRCRWVLFSYQSNLSDNKNKFPLSRIFFQLYCDIL